MLNVDLLSPQVLKNELSDDKILEFLRNFVEVILTSIDVEIRHLVNTKNEGIIVTPVDIDSQTE